MEPQPFVLNAKRYAGQPGQPFRYVIIVSLGHAIRGTLDFHTPLKLEAHDILDLAKHLAGSISRKLLHVLN